MFSYCTFSSTVDEAACTFSNLKKERKKKKNNTLKLLSLRRSTAVQPQLHSDRVCSEVQLEPPSSFVHSLARSLLPLADTGPPAGRGGFDRRAIQPLTAASPLHCTTLHFTPLVHSAASRRWLRRRDAVLRVRGERARRPVVVSVVRRAAGAAAARRGHQQRERKIKGRGKIPGARAQRTGARGSNQ